MSGSCLWDRDCSREITIEGRVTMSRWSRIESEQIPAREARDRTPPAAGWVGLGGSARAVLVALAKDSVRGARHERQASGNGPLAGLVGTCSSGCPCHFLPMRDAGATPGVS